MHVSTGVLLPVPCYTIISPSYAALQIVSNTPALKKKNPSWLLFMQFAKSVCTIAICTICYLYRLPESLPDIGTGTV